MRTLQHEYYLLDTDIKSQLGLSGITFERFQELDTMFAEQPDLRNDPQYRDDWHRVRAVVMSAHAAELRRRREGP